MKSLSLRFKKDFLEVLDQTLLPHEEKWIAVPSTEVMVELIQRLAVRGAPLIGVAAALSLGVCAQRATLEEKKNREKWKRLAFQLREARPTAVNLMHAMDRMLCVLESKGVESLMEEAQKIFQEDVSLCDRMTERGVQYIQDGDGILTHCNTGGLATVGVGTALGVIRKAKEAGKQIQVFVDETRPLLQGARLTAWELEKLNIPYTLICDNMAASLMRSGKIQKVFVGADRIARNGDTANKIGTYGLAVQCKFHHIPFYIVAPSTTFDENCASGAEIPIEERKPEEVRGGKAPSRAPVWNPAFDVTPKELITKIIFEDREM